MKNFEIIKSSEKNNNIINLITALLILLISFIFFMSDVITFVRDTQIFYLVMLLYFGIEFINYILTRKKTDYISLYTSLACIIAAISGLKYMYESSNLVLSITLLGWFILMIVIKLIKIENLRNKLKISTFANLFCLSIFILLGIFTIVNLYKGINNDLIVFGFFYIINGLLNLVETISDIKLNKIK